VAGVKVLMTADTVGGVLTYATDLAGALECDVVLATFGPERGAARHRDLKLEWMDEPWHDLALAEEWLLELERRERPDAVHVNGYVHGAAPFRAPTIVVGHSCVLSWWRAVKGDEAPRTWDRYGAAVRAGLHGANAVIAPTRFMLQELERLYGPLASAARVIHNGSAVPLRSGRKERLVLAAGRMWDEAKNLRVLQAASDGLDAPVLIAGTGAPLGRLAPRELDALRARAAVFAAPARYEPFGLAILEAARGGCSLVLGDIPSLRELWDGAARFVDPDDPDSLRAALRDALDHPRPALERARDFSVEAMARAYDALYHELVRMQEAT
jgi:glycosyltransferase involved in cell wall biosynthesis